MLGYEDVLQAAKTIEGKVERTPVMRALGLERFFAGAEIYLKLENLQRTGSFKLRGATYKMSSLTPRQISAGVVAASSGNHAQAVAWAATALGVKSTIVMPVDAPRIKLERTKLFGAEVVLCGTTGDEREQKAREIAAKTGATFVSSHADPYVIAGQGTIALELLEQAGALDEIVTPCGAGGLVSGVLLAAKGGPGPVAVTAVEPQGVPRFGESLLAGRPVTVPMGQTLADGLRVSKAEEINFEVIRRYGPRMVRQDDAHIKEMVNRVLTEQKVLAEPSSVIGLAAALEGKVDMSRGRKVAFIITGGNVDTGFLQSSADADG